MKATINGVTVEGTPQEIADYQRIVSVSKPVGTVPYVPKSDWITRGETQAITKDYAWNGPVSTLTEETRRPSFRVRKGETFEHWNGVTVTNDSYSDVDVALTLYFGGERKDGEIIKR